MLYFDVKREIFRFLSNKEISSMINGRYRNKNVSWIALKYLFSVESFNSSKFIDPKSYFYYELFLYESKKKSGQRKNFIHKSQIKLCNKRTTRIVCGSSKWIKSQVEDKKWPQIYIVSMTNLCESKLSLFCANLDCCSQETCWKQFLLSTMKNDRPQ